MNCATPRLLSKLRVALIIVDESHVVRPEYAVLKRLIAAGDLSDVKLLFASATAATDITLEQNPLRVDRVLPKSCDVPPEMQPRDSPLHYSQQQGRLILFTADDTEAHAWREYFEEHDVPAMVRGYNSRTGGLKHVVEFLRSNSLCVLVTTSVTETSYTLWNDRVVDLGRTSVMEYDAANSKVLLEKRYVTGSQQIQRAGRAGRLCASTAYKLDVPLQPEMSPESDMVSMYEYMWGRMYNLNIRVKSVSRWAGLMGTMSRATIAMVLTNPMPALAMMPFCADDGLYAQWGEGFKSIAFVRDAVVVSESVNSDRVAEWSEYEYRVHGEEELEAYVYRARVALPPPFDALLYHVWQSGMGGNEVAADDTVTLFGGGEFVRQRARAGSITAARQSVQTVQPERFAHSRAGSSISKMLPPVPTIPDRYRATIPEQYLAHSMVDPNEHIKPQRPRSVQAQDELMAYVSHENASIASGSAPREENMRRVSPPSKYWRATLWPYDTALREAFLELPTCTDLDVKRYRACVDGKRSFATLEHDSRYNAERQTEYFLSFLKVQQTALLDALQAQVSGKRAKECSRHLDRAHRAAKLLDVCDSTNLYSALDKSKRHSSVDEELDDLSRERDRASAALVMGPANVLAVVRDSVKYARPLYKFARNDKAFVAQGWAVNGQKITVWHAWDGLDDMSRDKWGKSVRTDDVHDWVCTGDGARDNFIVRSPIADENVYALAYHSTYKSVYAYGFSRVILLGDMVVIDSAFTAGFSGALMVSARDGAVVGIYQGVFGTIADVKYGLITDITRLSL